MSRLTHFEITGKDSAKLARFYAEQFGFHTQPSPFAPDYHLLQTGESGLSGAVMSRAYQDQAVILWFEVAELDASLAAITAAGGAASGERNQIPGQGYVQYVTDPQGNLLGLKQPA